MKYRITAHAIEQVQRRGLDRSVVESMLDGPQQVRDERRGREAWQSRVHFPDGEYLLRAIIDPAQPHRML